MREVRVYFGHLTIINPKRPVDAGEIGPGPMVETTLERLLHKLLHYAETRTGLLSEKDRSVFLAMSQDKRFSDGDTLNVFVQALRKQGFTAYWGVQGETLQYDK